MEQKEFILENLRPFPDATVGAYICVCVCV